MDVVVAPYSRDYLNREDWLTARKGGIGGSDAAAILKKSKWDSPWSVWAEKTGVYRKQIEEQYLVIGKLMEPVLAKLYTMETGFEVANPGDFRIFWGDENYQFATIDMIDESEIIVEGKTAGGGAGADWKDGPPLAYQIQVQHQMKVLGAERARIAVLFGSPYFHFRIYEVDRNERFIDLMTRVQGEFWTLVEKAIPPEIDGSDATTNVLKNLPREEGKVIEFDRDVLQEIDRQREEAKRQVEFFSEVQAKSENTIKALMGDAEIALVNGAKIYSFKADKRGTRRFLRTLKTWGLPV